MALPHQDENLNESNTINAVPFLPGYSCNPNLRVDFHKRHHFDLVNNCPQENDDGKVFAEAQPVKMTQQTAAVVEPHIGGATHRPNWLRYDGIVLRFYAYIKALSSVRRFVIFFYMEDSSVQISEIMDSSLASSLPQRPRNVSFLRRHRAPHTDQQRFICVDDIVVGSVLQVYGRSFTVYDCDMATRTFLEHELGIKVCDPLPCPKDSIEIQAADHAATIAASARARQNMRSLGCHLEIANGRPSRATLRRNQQFFKGNNTVLRLWAYVDPDFNAVQERTEQNALIARLQEPTSPLYLVHFYLVDSTAEVVLAKPQRLRGEGFPTTLIKRQRLPKTDSYSNLSVIGIDGDDEVSLNEYYSPLDFVPGRTLRIFGKDIVLIRADKLTQTFLQENGITNTAPVLVQARVTSADLAKANQTTPPPTGFGSEEDSLASCLNSLIPRAPKHDDRRLLALQGVVLRFLAEFDEHGHGHGAPGGPNEHRRFVLAYYPSDKTLSVFEKNAVQGGFPACKFFEKAHVKVGNRLLEPTDFHPGAVIEVNKFRFKVIKGDLFSEKFAKDAAATLKEN